MAINLLRVVNQQTLNRSILLDKIDRSQGNFEGYAQIRKQKIYVPYSNPSDPRVKGYVDLIGDEVLLQAESDGSIGGLILSGKVSAAFVSSALVATPVTTGATNPAPTPAITTTGSVDLTDGTPAVTTTGSVDLTDGPGFPTLVAETFSVDVGAGPVTVTLAGEVNFAALKANIEGTVGLAGNVIASRSGGTTGGLVLTSVATGTLATITVADVAGGVAVLGLTLETVTGTDIASTINGTTFLSVSPDVTYVEFTNLAGGVQIINATSFSHHTATQIVIPDSAITGLPITGWKVRIFANSKWSNSFTLT